MKTKKPLEIECADGIIRLSDYHATSMINFTAIVDPHLMPGENPCLTIEITALGPFEFFRPEDKP